MLTSLIQTFKEGQHASICGQSAPTNQVGCPRDESHTGFFVYTKSDYTLWFKNQSGSWVQHQQISSVDPTARTFHWYQNLELVNMFYHIMLKRLLTTMPLNILKEN